MTCSRWCSKCRDRKGLTGIEIAVLLVVVLTILGLLLPLVASSRERARHTQCADNMKRLGTALQSHVNLHNAFPPSHSDFRQANDSTWLVHCLPFLDEQGMFDRYSLALPWNHLANREVVHSNLAFQHCPAARHQDDGQGDYAAIYGPRELPGIKRGWEEGRAYAMGIMIAVGGETGNKPIRPTDVTDGLAKTITLGEDSGRTDESRFWGDPYQAFVQEAPINSSRADELFSDHPGGAHVLFGDGHAHFMPQTTDLSIIDALVTRARQEIVPDAFTIDYLP
jgi:prepilin-type processing-associated H-X9-DG protein